MVCTNAEARHSTQRVLHYLESLKDMETEREGNLILLRCFKPLILFVDFMIFWICGLDCRTSDNEESIV
jgi:hypothetical protein